MAAAQPVEDKPKNLVRVSINQSKFLYCSVVKYLLNDKEPFVQITGLGQAIPLVVDVAEILKNQGLVEVTKVETTRGVPEARRQAADQMSVYVKRAAGFDKVFAELEKEKEERKAAKEESKKE